MSTKDTTSNTNAQIQQTQNHHTAQMINKHIQKVTEFVLTANKMTFS